MKEFQRFVGVRLQDRQFALVTRIAEADGESVSSVIREAVDRHVAVKALEILGRRDGAVLDGKGAANG